VCPVLAIVIDGDPARAIDISRRRHVSFYMKMPNYTNNLRRLGFCDDDFQGGGSDRLVEALTAWGSIDQICDRAKAHFDAGADHVIVQVISEEDTPPIDAWRELAPALLDVAPPAKAVV